MIDKEKVNEKNVNHELADDGLADAVGGGEVEIVQAKPRSGEQGGIPSWDTESPKAPINNSIWERGRW